SEAQANKRESEPARDSRAPARPRPAEPPRRRADPEEAARGRPIPKLPPLAVPNNKELQRLEAKKQVELDRRIRELVTSAEVPVEPGDHTFYFVTRKNRLRRISLRPEVARQLETGELAVVERPEPAQIEHSLVPAETAERLLALSTRAVRFYNRKDAPVGFLSDEELLRRQREEAAEPPAPAADDPAAVSHTPHLASASEQDGARSASADD
ncbi:MAG TPA: DUF2058 family protein, partial [Myxococcaceae bacterium]|nr:DUF2058 family protein [Myxococcaceae bacterium]